MWQRNLHYLLAMLLVTTLWYVMMERGHLTNGSRNHIPVALLADPLVEFERHDSASVLKVILRRGERPWAI